MSTQRRTLVSDAEYLRGSLLQPFTSWEDQDECVHELVTTTTRLTVGDVIAVPAFLSSVRQDGYYIARLEKLKKAYFYIPLSAGTFCPGTEFITLLSSAAVVHLKRVIIFPDGTCTLRKSVNFQVRKALERRGFQIAGSDRSDSEDEPASITEIVPVKPNLHKTKRRRVVPDDLVDEEDKDEGGSGGSAFCLHLPPGYPNWEAVDARIARTNAVVANVLEERGFVGMRFIACPGPESPKPSPRVRVYSVARIDAYSHRAKVLQLTVLGGANLGLVPVCKQTRKRVCIANAFLPVLCYEKTPDVFRLLETLQLSLQTHLSVLDATKIAGVQAKPCTYAAEKRALDGHKREQNRIIARAANTAGCRNAIVLDSIGYCTSTRLLKKAGLAGDVYVPNNSSDCAAMQSPPVGVTLLAGKSLLQTCEAWSVELQGPLTCLVADTCQHFNEDLKAALVAAFPKLGEQAVVSVTVSTRKQCEEGRRDTLKEVKAFVKAQAAAAGFVFAEKFMPDLYRNMLFVLFSLKRTVVKNVY